jgi:hypothetical protein
MLQEQPNIDEKRSSDTIARKNPCMTGKQQRNLSQTSQKIFNFHLYKFGAELSVRSQVGRLPEYLPSLRQTW